MFRDNSISFAVYSMKKWGRLTQLNIMFYIVCQNLVFFLTVRLKTTYGEQYYDCRQSRNDTRPTGGGGGGEERKRGERE